MPEETAELRGRVQRIKSLPTLPGVVKKLCSMVESDFSSAAEIGEIISTDQVLTAKVLKIVNSSFYGFPGRISTISHALVLLGFNVVKGIILTAAVLDYMTDSMVGLWEHSLGVAAASKKIALWINADEPDEISTAGLLHDLGKVILCVEMKAESQKIADKVVLAKISFIEAERKVLDGLSHCEIAGWLAEDWNLPPRLREPISLHHKPQSAQFAPVPTAVVHLADVMVRSLQFGSGGDPYIPALNPAAMKTLGLKLSDLTILLEEIDDELEGIDTSEFV